MNDIPGPADWLADAVLYEIYPQSFADTDGDGIGDFPGVLAHLDHLHWLGVDTIWFNPCFASPFVDAGYDVSDYQLVAPRYGSNDDLIAVIEAARERGIRVLLDLVAGHTSSEHSWFQAEANAAGPDPLGDRYVWTDSVDADQISDGNPRTRPWVASPGTRSGYYLKNFYDAQPALNFGYASLDPEEPWRQPADAPGPQRNRQALREIMSFWLDRGVAGFRVDMAFSLVKDDPGYQVTTALWRDLRAWLDQAYPAAVLIPEGSEPHAASHPPAFHAEFFLVIGAAHQSLFANGGAGELPWRPAAPCFFDAEGRGSVDTLLQEWNAVRSARPDRPILLGSSDHDFARMATGRRSYEQLGAAYTFLLTWGSVPSIYYGDEIGIRNQDDLTINKEGSLIFPGFYDRAGTRTPMQWDTSPNAGFSTAPAEHLYLPIDPDPERQTVSAALEDPSSLIHLIRRLIALRKEIPALGTRSAISVVHAGYPFVYRRGDHHLVVVNPGQAPATLAVPGLDSAKEILNSGVTAGNGKIHADGFAYAILETPGRRSGGERSAPA
ncbi:MAG: alpha-amylase family glycosyl hydrolase [Jatrophihabitans sp.]